MKPPTNNNETISLLDRSNFIFFVVCIGGVYSFIQHKNVVKAEKFPKKKKKTKKKKKKENQKLTIFKTDNPTNPRPPKKMN